MIFMFFLLSQINPWQSYPENFIPDCEKADSMNLYLELTSPNYMITATMRPGAPTSVNWKVWVPVLGVFDLSCGPNPCRGEMRINFMSSGSKNLLMRVFDVSDRIVYCENALTNAGSNSIVWNFVSDDGLLQASGVYYARI